MTVYLSLYHPFLIVKSKNYAFLPIPIENLTLNQYHKRRNP